VFVPLVPKSEAKKGEPVKVVLKSTRITGEKELLTFFATPKLEVVVVPNNALTFSEKLRDALAKEVPGTNFAETIVLHEGYEHGMTMAVALSIVSVLFLVLGGFVLLSGLRGAAA
jgi:hypothetical protein